MSKGLRERWGNAPIQDRDQLTTSVPYAVTSAADYRRQMLDGADRESKSGTAQPQWLVQTNLSSKDYVKAVHERFEHEEEATRKARFRKEDGSWFQGHGQVHGQFEHEENDAWFRGLQEDGHSIYTDSAKDYRKRMVRGESLAQRERVCGTSSSWTKLRSENNRLVKELKEEQRPTERPANDDADQKPVVPMYELESTRIVASWSAREAKSTKNPTELVSDQNSNQFIPTHISRKNYLPPRYWGYDDDIPSGYKEFVHKKDQFVDKPPDKINSFVDLMRKIKSNASKYEADQASKTQESKFGEAWGKIQHIVEAPH